MKVFFRLSLLALCVSLAGIGYAQQTQEQLAQAVPGALARSVTEGMTRQISLDLRGIDVVDAIKYLAIKGGLNVVTTRGVTGQVNLFLQDVTVRDALDIILLTNGLALEARSGILTVMTEGEYETVHGYRYNDQREVRTLGLKFANAGKVAAMLEGIKSSLGRIIADEGTGVLVLVDVPERLERMEAAVNMLDLDTVIRPAPTVSEVFSLKYNKVADVQANITAALTPTLGSVRSDVKTNTMIITDLPHRMPEFRKMVEAFDQKTRQVYIEAKIVQINLTDEFDLGVEWQTIIKQKDLNGLNFQASLPITLSTFGKLAVGTIGSDHLGAIIKALEKFGKTDVLSTPHISVLNNEEATILVGTKEVYVTSTTSQGTSTATTSEAVNFIDVGIKLKVTPTINEDGFVVMKITPEVSSVSRSVTTAQGNQIPVVETSTASTTVMAKDGATVVLGGLMKNQKLTTTNQIPLLGSLPVLGPAFRSKIDHKLKTELVVFLTPHIITGETTVNVPVLEETPKGFKEPPA